MVVSRTFNKISSYNLLFFTSMPKEPYFQEDSSKYFDITRGYSGSGVLFYQCVVYKNKLGNPYAIYEKIDDERGFYRRINSSGSHSGKSFDTFSECIKYHGEVFF